MQLTKTLLLALLGLGATAFAAPAPAEASAAAAELTADACDRIPYDERHRYRECEHDRDRGDRRGECRDIPRDRRPNWCYN
ncbi:hypothetical protein EJ06DRAFT_582403 [Trichodelitschia bisporula]|uniref:Uncharacterized protein n=1 Tax=Trichodelitschia bisporula TaxID=703511 RepID=A0A6G1HV89_9PEZI|nr:hypothetical protein EJ06DRAFT_582403 [Trichodelitschia bisporula]